MQKRDFHPAFGRRRTSVAEKRKTKKALEEYGGSRKKTFLCPTTEDATYATLLRRCRCSKTACAFGAAAPAAVFAGV